MVNKQILVFNPPLQAACVVNKDGVADCYGSNNRAGPRDGSGKKNGSGSGKGTGTGTGAKDGSCKSEHSYQLKFLTKRTTL